MQSRGFVQNIVIIAVILILVFLSQQAYARLFVQKIYSQVNAAIQPYWLTFSGWVKITLYPKLSGEVATRGGAVTQELNAQKNIAAQSLWDKIKLFFAEKFSNFFGTPVK